MAARMERVRGRMSELGVDALLLSIGADLPWLTGYTAMPLERLTMLVLPVEGHATLVVPRLEEPRVQPHADLFAVRPWDETEDAVGIVAGLIGGRHSLAVSDRIKARLAPAAVVLGSSTEGRVHLIATLDQPVVDRGLSAVDLIREIAPLVGGGGGGRPRR